jgi:2-C-methyl-D-erythritol 4-phosphate cytidylyltransferase
MIENELLRGVSIVVPAAGRGARMGDAGRKQYMLLNGKPMLQYVLDKMLALGARHVVVAVAADDEGFRSLAGHECCRVVAGGASRTESVASGLSSLQLSSDDWVMVHDGARPCVQLDDIVRLVRTVAKDEVGGILAVPVMETVKRAGEDERVAATVSREGLWLAQTPQLFRYGLLERALAEAARSNFETTDEASAVERLGLSPMLVRGRRDNIKVTTPEDVALAEYYLRLQGCS